MRTSSLLLDFEDLRSSDEDWGRQRDSLNSEPSSQASDTDSFGQATLILEAQRSRNVS